MVCQVFVQSQCASFHHSLLNILLIFRWGHSTTLSILQYMSDLNNQTVGKYLKYLIFQKILAMLKEKLLLLLPLLISFLLGFLLNSVLYILPDMMVSVRCLKIYLMIIMQTMKKMMMTPTLQNYQFFQFPFQDKNPDSSSTVSQASHVRVLCLVMTGPQKFYTKVGILCWVMTGPHNHYTKV